MMHVILSALVLSCIATLGSSSTTTPEPSTTAGPYQCGFGGQQCYNNYSICLNGGTCVNGSTVYSGNNTSVGWCCQCAYGYIGSYCQTVWLSTTIAYNQTTDGELSTGAVVGIAVAAVVVVGAVAAVAAVTAAIVLPASATAATSAAATSAAATSSTAAGVTAGVTGLTSVTGVTKIALGSKGNESKLAKVTTLTLFQRFRAWRDSRVHPADVLPSAPSSNINHTIIDGFEDNNADDVSNSRITITIQSEDVIKNVPSSELLSMFCWLGICDWARRFSDHIDGIHIGVRNKSKEEVLELIRVNNYEHIPTIIFDMDAFSCTYQKSWLCPGTNLYSDRCPNIYSLSSGSIQNQVLTVGHLFDTSIDIGTTASVYVDNVPTDTCRLRHATEYIAVPPNLFALDRLHADIALLDPVPNKCKINNKITLTTKNSCINRQYQLCLNKMNIVRCSKVMILDKNKVVQYGHIESTLFTDKDHDLYNAITIVSTDRLPHRAITEEGDSGALVMGYQDIKNCSYSDVMVNGFVTGVYYNNEIPDGTVMPTLSMTVANRLWDVLSYYDRVDSTGSIDFQITP